MAKKVITHQGPFEPFGASRETITLTLTTDEYISHAWMPRRFRKLRKPILRFRVWHDLQTTDDGEQIGHLVWEGIVPRNAPWKQRNAMAREQMRQADLYVADTVAPERLNASEGGKK